MSDGVRLTVLAEDTAGGAGLLGEHGLAIWVEAGGDTVLFDTGQGLALGHNAAALGIPLHGAGAVALSHGHYDHTGGLGAVVSEDRRIDVFAHPMALVPKYARRDGGVVREIGIPSGALQEIRTRAEIHLVTGLTEIVPGVFLTGPIPRVTEFEDSGGKFFEDPECRRPDRFPDDQALFFDRGEGTVVVLGCAHAGAINTLLRVREITGDRPIAAVLGGMHLVGASPERIDRTAAELKRLGVSRIFPVHCTGMEAAARLWAELPGRCGAAPAGTTLTFP